MMETPVTSITFYKMAYITNIHSVGMAKILERDQSRNTSRNYKLEK
jgi:hypothetical protein